MRIRFQNIFEERNPQLEIITIHIKTFVGTAVDNEGDITAPYIIVANNCQSIVNDIANDSTPRKIIMMGKKKLELPNGDIKEFLSKLAYANNAYINAFGEGDLFDE